MERLRDLQERGPPQGYFLEPIKSILVVALQNVARVEELFLSMGIKIVTGSSYLGGFIGDRLDKDSWLAAKVQGWTELVKTLSGVANKHP